MEAGRLKHVVFIGSGNVASSLAPAIDGLGDYAVVQIYSPTLEHACRLAGCLSGAKAVCELAQIDKKADIYIISVKDDALDEVVQALKGVNQDALWVHTAGTLGIDRVAALSSFHGVFYPLQTFSRFKTVAFENVPVFVESSCQEAGSMLVELARRLSRRVYQVDSDTRRAIHVAAVFACNFTNHIWTIAEKLLADRNLPFDVLAPLLHETLDKALAVSPALGQTGPARRRDISVMNSHLSILPENLKPIYRLLSESIVKMYQNE